MECRSRCILLREIRRKVCDINGLEYDEPDCPHAEDCRRGTCPACEAQLERINVLLEERRRHGLAVSYDGLTEVYEDKRKSL